MCRTRVDGLEILIFQIRKDNKTENENVNEIAVPMIFVHCEEKFEYVSLRGKSARARDV